MVGKYTVGAMESQVWVKGAAGTKVWLGVKLARSRRGVVRWMHSGELQRRVGDDSGWREKLRGRGREVWMVQRHRWKSNGKETVVGRGKRGEVMGWYLPVSVVDEKALTRAGVRVVVRMRRGAVGRSAGAYTKAVGIRSRREWCRHTISRKGLVGVTGRLVHEDEQEEVLVVGEEVWEEWTGQEVEGTDWRKGAKDEWEAKERAVVRGNWLRSVDRDCVYDRG